MRRGSRRSVECGCAGLASSSSGTSSCSRAALPMPSDSREPALVQWPVEVRNAGVLPFGIGVPDERKTFIRSTPHTAGEGASTRIRPFSLADIERTDRFVSGRE